LIVLNPQGAGGETTERHIENALIASGRPVLIAQPSSRLTPPDCAVVAWNRGVYSSRALAAALPFLQACPRVVIVYVETGAKPGPSPEEAASYLTWHGVQATVDRLAAGAHGVGDLLLQRAASHGADLLVMGASYHNRVSELLAGGVTRYVLRHAEVALLMAH
jgi:nucleotide-binding universal stress UspA family protein